MSSTDTGFTEDLQHRRPQRPTLGVNYTPTEEERMVFKECNHESFWYRSVPFSVISMALTQALVTKGSVTVSTRFGSLPKVAFAGFCGYLIGKVSYMKTCQEKFKRLENSPLGEALRQAAGMSQQYSAQSEFSDPDKPTFDSMFQPADAPGQRGYYTGSPGHLDRLDDFRAPVESYEEEPRKKGTLYEDLRLKNRENYEVTLTERAGNLLQRSPEKDPRKTKNIYGDTWEE